MSPDKPSFFSSHTLAIALAVAVILFLIGGFVVLRRSGRTPSPETTTWGVSGAALPNSNTGIPSFAEAGKTDFTNTPIEILRFTAPAESAAGTQGSAPPQTFESFLSGLFGNTTRASAAGGGLTAETLQAYFYLPEGTVSTTQRSETPVQAALHTYGNAVGAIIVGFESSHPDMLNILTAQAENREDPKSAAALKDLADDLAGIGAALEEITDIPEDAASIHAALAAGYQEIGAKLAAVAEIGSDEAYLASINAYNTSADAFTRRFLEMATLFSISGVSFSSTEGGSAFTLPSGGGF